VKLRGVIPLTVIEASTITALTHLILNTNGDRGFKTDVSYDGVMCLVKKKKNAAISSRKAGVEAGATHALCFRRSCDVKYIVCRLEL
jgi:hypothetical protein